MRRHRLLLGSMAIVVCAALAGCAGATPPTPTPAGQGNETFPDVPTANASAGDPFDTLPPGPTAGPSGAITAGIVCVIQPSIVTAGQPYVLLVSEIGDWYGNDRYYQVTGLPTSYHELQTADGGPTTRALVNEVAPDFGGTNWTVVVFMRDWDIHGIRPDTGLPTTIRPASTDHEGSCTANLEIALNP